MELEEYEYQKIETNHDEKAENRPGNISYFELYKYSTNFDKLLLVVAVLFGVGSGLSEASFFLIFGRCIGAIANFGNDFLNAANDTEKLQVEEVFVHRANEFAIFNVAISLTIFITTYISTYLFNYTAMKQAFRIRELYFSKVINQDISWHDQMPTGDFASRIVDDLQKIQEGINDKMAIAVIQSTFIVSCVVQSFIFGWKLTLASLISLPLSVLMMAFIGKLSTKLSKDETEVYGEAGKVADETLTYIKTVVAFNGQSEETKRYDKLLLCAMKNNIKRYFFAGMTFGATNLLYYFGMTIGLWYGARLLTQGRENYDRDSYSIENIVIVYNGVMMANYYTGTMTPLLSMFNAAKGAAAKIFSVIESQTFINKSYNTETDIRELKGNISFENVRFCYPARPQVEVLKNFNLEVASGDTIALVGSSGCGKSTIIQLIQRFYDANHGQICLDGYEIKNLNLKNVRHQIGMVGQEPVLFDGTIEENIKLGQLSATRADIEEAARKSNAHSFITSFPNGYQTVIGERGAQLSGGQKQRIAIARALVRKPAILLLDEATSALDSNSESIVQAALDEVSKACTTIIVAHRLSTIRHANRIVVLENGAVVDEGSHDELMMIKGAYYNLVVTQLSGDGENNSNGCKPETTEEIEKYQDSTVSTKEDQAVEKVDFKLATVWKILKKHLSPKWCMLAGIVCSMGHIFCTIGCSIFLGKALVVMADLKAEYMISQVNIYSACIISLGVIVAISFTFQSYFIGIAGENLTVNLRSSMFKAMICQDMGWFDSSKNGVGSLGARLAGEPSSVQTAISVCSGPFINVVIAVSSYLFIGIYFCWQLLLCSFCVVPFLAFLLYLEHKILVAENRKSMEVMEQSTKLAVEAITNVRTVASLVIEKTFQNLYMLKLKSYQSATVRNMHIQSVVHGLSRSVLPLSYLITVYYGAYLIKIGETDAVSVIAMAEIFVFFLWIITYSLIYFPNITKGFVACNQINELLNRTPEMKLSSKLQIADASLATEEIIQYSKVFFSYPTRLDTKILDGFDLSVLKGKTVALVGPSGCGKSTVIQLLERFYDSDFGRITFGNKDIYGINLDTLRFRFGIIMQEPNLFSRTIEENIAYGNVDTEVPKAEIIQAAQKANIHNFITSLPLGYKTVLGEKGTQLSGGQKQRIAIARALVRNPEVLLLDEATSSLDAESEKIVQEALNNAKEERTCIVIAHRLKTVIDSDLIVVIEKGKVAEKGTHRELMNLQGLYWNLYNLQQQS